MKLCLNYTHFISMHTFIYMYIHIHLYIRVYIHICIYVCLYIFKYTYMGKKLYCEKYTHKFRLQKFLSEKSEKKCNYISKSVIKPKFKNAL